MTNGTFIVLEGPDGSGKTTQARMLIAALEAEGRDVVAVREPGHTALGEKVRSILLDHGDQAMDERAEACLFSAARAQLVTEVIGPALDAGQVVISDRFGLSTLVYQGYHDGVIDARVEEMVCYATRDTRPDLTLVFDLAPEAARARRGARADDRMEAKGTAYHRRVRQGYLAAARSDPERIVVIDASETDAAAVHARVLEEVRRVLG